MWASSSEVVGWDGAEVSQGRNTVFVGFPVTSGGAILSPRWLSTGHMGNVGLSITHRHLGNGDLNHGRQEKDRRRQY